MKKHFRLFSIFLVIILSFSFLSVNSLAADETNLVDSNLSNWVDYGENSSLYQSANVSYLGNNTNYITVSGSNKVVVLYDLTEFLKIGESYEFSFSLPNTEGLNNNSLNSCNLSWYLCDGSNTEFPIAGEEIFRISINNSNKSNYLGKTTAFEFTYTQGFKNTCLCLSIFPGEDLNAYNYLQLYISNVKLQRIASESEKKLDGILGWLQELYNSIINGFTNLGDSLTNVWQRITTKLGDISTNITSSITDSWQRITTKIGDVITNISGEITALGDKLINYLLYFGDTVPDNPFDGVDSPLEHIQGFFDDLIDYLSSIGDDIETVIDSITGPVTLLDHFTKRFEWLFGIVTFTLMLIVVSRFIGL